MNTKRASSDTTDDSARHRANNFLSRIIACAEGAIDAAENPDRVRELMEVLIDCAQNAPDLFALGVPKEAGQATDCSASIRTCD